MLNLGNGFKILCRTGSLRHTTVFVEAVKQTLRWLNEPMVSFGKTTVQYSHTALETAINLGMLPSAQSLVTELRRGPNCWELKIWVSNPPFQGWYKPLYCIQVVLELQPFV